MIWREKGMFDVKEQRLLDQKWQVVTKKWFSDLDFNDITENLMVVNRLALQKWLLRFCWVW